MQRASSRVWSNLNEPFVLCWRRLAQRHGGFWGETFSSPHQAVLCSSSKIKDKVRARKHAYILIQTRVDFLLQSASESVFRAERHLFFSIACKHWANHQTLPCTYAKPFDTKNKQSNGSLSSKRTAGLVQDFLFYTNMNDIFICTVTLSQAQRL